jgi:hypothetical protein
MPQAFQHRVAYIDYHGRISEEGQETAIANERRTTFVRKYLDGLGHDGWELVGIQPVNQHAAYYVFKRQADPTAPYVPLERHTADDGGTATTN